MKGPNPGKIFFKLWNSLSHCENTPFMHIRIREKISSGPVERGLRDVTRRQFIKNSTGKLFFLPSGLTIKKQGEWLQRSVLGPPPALARPRDEVSIGWFTKTRRSRERTEMLYSNPRKCQYLCSQHLQACSFDCHTDLPSEQRSRKRSRLNFMPTEQKKDYRRPNAIGMKFSLLRLRDLCSEGTAGINIKFPYRTVYWLYRTF